MHHPPCLRMPNEPTPAPPFGREHVDETRDLRHHDRRGLRTGTWMAAKSILALAKIVALIAFGCGPSDRDVDGPSGGAAAGSAGASSGGSDGGTAPSAGLGGSTAGAAGAAGAGGTGNAGNFGGGGGTGGSAGSAGKGGSAGNSGDAGHGGSAGGAQDCLSPCLRELFATCRAQTSCVAQTFENSLRQIQCEVATGYRSVVDVDAPAPEPQLVVTLNGQPCYTAFLEDQTWTYHAPDDSVVGTATLDPAGNHGRCPKLETGGVEVEYAINTSDPRCAPVTCTPGTCP
jgi:hypothetical protein